MMIYPGSMWRKAHAVASAPERANPCEAQHPMFKLTSLILRNVLRNRRRTLLTLLSLSISLCLLGLIVALFQGFFYADDASPASARRLICRHKVSLAQPMPISHIDKIRTVRGVEKAAPYIWFQG